MRDVAIIADDLTGAADCGIAFAAAGLSTFVAVGDLAADVTVQVVAVDTDSRSLGTRDASARTRAAAARAVRDGARALYKKVDSTLRGHVGAELAATLAAVADGGRGPALLVFAPAFPATGRTTRDGRVLVGGVPLEETEVWRDARMAGPAEPAAMLSGAGVRTAVASLAEVRAGADALAARLERLAREADAVVCDAVEEDDLRAIALAGARLARPVVWAGSGGLARHLPAALSLRPDPSRAPARRLPAPGAMVALVGSRSSVAREQARRLAAEPGVDRIELAPRPLLAGDREPGEALERALAAGRDVVVVLGAERVEPERGVELAAAAGRLVAAHSARLAAVVATGGDMARGLLAALGATGLYLLGELEPGVPLGVADARPLVVVTKAGAFGSPETLVRCRAALARFTRGGSEEGTT